MTDQVRFRAALCLSFFLHFMLLHAHWAGSAPGQGGGERLRQEIQASGPPVADTLTVAIESAAEPAPPGNGEDKRQKEREAYLEAVSDAIHARRFAGPEADRRLIGLAWFSFTVAADGGFHNIVLTGSSGNPALDRAAETAVRGASGAVKRPAGLGHEAIAVGMAVKYQYEW